MSSKKHRERNRTKREALGHQVYDRLAVFSPAEVLPYVIFAEEEKSLYDRGLKKTDPAFIAQTTKEYAGVMVNMTSQRYRTFAKHGISCCMCRIQGKFFALERHAAQHSSKYHFNLYAIDIEGKEVLMTKDHVVPKAQGGKEHVSNYRPMCTHCNAVKGSMKFQGEERSHEE